MTHFLKTFMTFYFIFLCTVLSVIWSQDYSCLEIFLFSLLPIYVLISFHIVFKAFNTKSCVQIWVKHNFVCLFSFHILVSLVSEFFFCLCAALFPKQHENESLRGCWWNCASNKVIGGWMNYSLETFNEALVGGRGREVWGRVWAWWAGESSCSFLWTGPHPLLPSFLKFIYFLFTVLLHYPCAFCLPCSCALFAFFSFIPHTQSLFKMLESTFTHFVCHCPVWPGQMSDPRTPSS